MDSFLRKRLAHEPSIALFENYNFFLWCYTYYFFIIYLMDNSLLRLLATIMKYYKSLHEKRNTNNGYKIDCVFGDIPI